MRQLCNLANLTTFQWSVAFLSEDTPGTSAEATSVYKLMTEMLSKRCPNLVHLSLSCDYRSRLTDVLSGSWGRLSELHLEFDDDFVDDTRLTEFLARHLTLQHLHLWNEPEFSFPSLGMPNLRTLSTSCSMPIGIWKTQLPQLQHFHYHNHPHGTFRSWAESGVRTLKSLSVNLRSPLDPDFVILPPHLERLSMDLMGAFTLISEVCLVILSVIVVPSLTPHFRVLR